MDVLRFYFSLLIQIFSSSDRSWCPVPDWELSSATYSEWGRPKAGQDQHSYSLSSATGDDREQVYALISVSRVKVICTLGPEDWKLPRAEEWTLPDVDRSVKTAKALELFDPTSNSYSKNGYESHWHPPHQWLALFRTKCCFSGAMFGELNNMYKQNKFLKQFS